MNEHKSLTNFTVLIIYGVFIILIIVSLMIGTRYYYQVSQNNIEDTYLRSSMSYLSNKIRNNEITNGIKIEEHEQVNCLVIDNLTNKTYLYVYDGYLREYSLTTEGTFIPSIGDKITKMDAIAYKLDQNILTITLNKDNGEKEMVLSLRCDHD